MATGEKDEDGAHVSRCVRDRKTGLEYIPLLQYHSSLYQTFKEHNCSYIFNVVVGGLLTNISSCDFYPNLGMMFKKASRGFHRDWCRRSCLRQ